jgi:hypothetical protein
MKFRLTPQRSNVTLNASADGDVLVINGVGYDLAPLTSNQSLPPSALNGVAGTIKRVNGVIVVPIVNPYDATEQPPEEQTIDAPSPSSDWVMGVVDWSQVSTDQVQEVTMRQARLALLSVGLLDQVEAAINALPDPPRTSALIEWQHSNTVQRNNPFVTQLGGLLGLTPEQLDNLFIAAAKL